MGRIPRKIEGNGSPVKHLWEVHREIARLQVGGMRPVEIARKLGYTQAWLSTIMCSPVYKEYLATLSTRRDDSAVDVRSSISEGAKLGVAELLKALKGEGEYKEKLAVSNKIKIAQDFLDRDGFGKISKVQTTSDVNIIDRTRIEAIKEKREMLMKNLSRTISIPTIEDACIVSGEVPSPNLIQSSPNLLPAISSSSSTDL